MATPRRRPASGPEAHQGRILEHLRKGPIQAEVLRRKVRLNPANFQTALGDLKQRGVVYVTQGSGTKADGEVYLAPKQGGLPDTATTEQSRREILRRMGL